MRMPTLSLLLDAVLEGSSLPRQVGKRKKERHPNWKGSILPADGMIVCRENPRKSTHTCKSIRLTELSKVSGYKTDI